MTSQLIDDIVVFGNLLILPAIFVTTLREKPFGLQLLVAALPLLALGRRLTMFQTLPISMETIAVFFLWFCAQLHDLKYKHVKNPTVVRVYQRNFFSLIAADVFILAGLISTLRVGSTVPSLNFLVAGGIAPLIMFFLAARFLSTEQDLQLLAISLILISIQTAFYTWATGQRHSVQIAGKFEGAYMGDLVIAGLFAVPSGTMSVLVTTIPFSLWYMQFGRYQREVIGFLGFFSAAFAAIYSLSRGAWLGILIAIFASLPLFFSGFSIRRVLVVVLVIVAAYWVGIYDFFLDAVMRQFSDPITSSLSVQLRQENFLLSIESSATFPLIGLGLGHYSEVYEFFPNAKASGMYPLWFSHNLFLTLIPEIGFIGATSFAFLVLGNLIHGLRAYNEEVDGFRATVIYACVIGILGYLFISVTTGTHLVLYFVREGSTYFLAPALIIVFALFGTIRAIVQNKQILRATTQMTS